MVGWMVRWMVGWLVGWVVGWMVGRLVGWVVEIYSTLKLKRNVHFTGDFDSPAWERKGRRQVRRRQVRRRLAEMDVMLRRDQTTAASWNFENISKYFPFAIISRESPSMKVIDYGRLEYTTL